MDSLKFTADLRGVRGVRWFTVQDGEGIYVHADDGDFQDRIKIPKHHPRIKDMVYSAVLALESHVRRRRLNICRQQYGILH
ncbi:hypothetical protein Luutsna6_00014 [Pseudomonas phage vB_PpuP-Luutsna-6]